MLRKTRYCHCKSPVWPPSRLSVTLTYCGYIGYSVSQKNPIPWVLLPFSPNGWEFLAQVLHAYYAFLSKLNGRANAIGRDATKSILRLGLFHFILFNYLQLWTSYAVLSATTQFTSCVQNVACITSVIWDENERFVIVRRCNMRCQSIPVR